MFASHAGDNLPGMNTKPRVLIVDDELEVLDLIQYRLEHSGFAFPQTLTDYAKEDLARGR